MQPNTKLMAIVRNLDKIERLRTPQLVWKLNSYDCCSHSGKKRIRLILVNALRLLAMVVLAANCLVGLGAVTLRDGWCSTDYQAATQHQELIACYCKNLRWARLWLTPCKSHRLNYSCHRLINYFVNLVSGLIRYCLHLQQQAIALAHNCTASCLTWTRVNLQKLD